MSRSNDGAGTGRRTGYFVFSLDTEMAWGAGLGYRKLRLSKNGVRERTAFERLLRLMDLYGIVGTWAVVGHLFFERCEGCIPCAIEDWRGMGDGYDLIHEQDSRLWYGADMIRSLLKCGQRQEIAFHGHTHRRFDEGILSEASARREIEEWVRLAQRFGLKPGAVVFPQNKVGFLRLFLEYGFTCYRGPEVSSPAESWPLAGRLLRRYHRQLSSFLPSSVYPPPFAEPEALLNIPSTQHFFGYGWTARTVLDAISLHELGSRQMVGGVYRAAKERKVFHLRAHPLDFRTEGDFARLSNLFKDAAGLVRQGLLKSVGMGELAEILKRDPVAPLATVPPRPS